MMLAWKQARFTELGEDFYQAVVPEALPNPQLVAFSENAAACIGLSPEVACRDFPQHEDFIRTFSASEISNDLTVFSTVYSGHQFGYYTEQLGDGRAVTIGELGAESGAESGGESGGESGAESGAESGGELDRYEIQLKGSGRTPYSRFGDGKAVLRSCIREFLCSEAMAALGIPTTRALCVIDSSQTVLREQPETAAILTRLAPSHIRFGHFEYFYFERDVKALQRLADFCLEHYFAPQAQQPKPYAALLQEATIRTAQLIAAWQCAGFAHGVMNSDNMSILGLTLDYGPFGFMEAFDNGFICNQSDEQGRYAFYRQPAIGLWNLQCLARALSPLIEMEDIHSALEHYEPAYLAAYEDGMRRKLGLEYALPEDRELIRHTLYVLHEESLDYTLFFRLISSNPNQLDNAGLGVSSSAAIERWWQHYRARLQREQRSEDARMEAMRQVNPKYILRNYLAQQAIEKAQRGDYQEVRKLHDILRKPFDDQPEHEEYAAPPPDWARGLQVSCSS